MTLILAPYNNAMRLGQGFNSYTQQICINDAVVVDPERAENIITNDGATMRILVQSMGRPSAWSRHKEIVADDVPEIEHEDSAESEPAAERTKTTSAAPRISQRQSRPAIAKTSRDVGNVHESSGEVTGEADPSDTEGKEDAEGGSGVLVESADVENEAEGEPETHDEESDTAKPLALAVDDHRPKKQSMAGSDEEEKRELMAADKELMAAERKRGQERRAEQAEIAKEKREQYRALRKIYASRKNCRWRRRSRARAISARRNAEAGRRSC